MAEKILLDTSMLIDILDKGRDMQLLKVDCYLSIISIYEYIRYKHNAEEQKLLLEGAFEVVSFSNPIILKASEIFVKLKRAGKSVSENDVYIAASAIANGLKLYTKDADFKEINRLFPEFRVVIV